MKQEDAQFIGTEALNRVLHDDALGSTRIIRWLTSREQDDLLGALEVLAEVIWAVQEDEKGYLLCH